MLSKDNRLGTSLKPARSIDPYQLCCEIREACNDGIDNDADGLIDCVDLDCNEKGQIFNPSFTKDADMSGETVPEICDFDPDSPYDGNMQNTTECVDNPARCRGPDYAMDPDNDGFYCAYGQFDSPDVEPRGVCCPIGTDAKFNRSGNGEWSCETHDQCGGASLSNPTCDYNITSNETAFFNSTFSGNSNNYCVTQVPDLHQPDNMVTEDSAACCQVPRFGEQEYWFKDGNVEVYG